MSVDPTIDPIDRSEDPDGSARLRRCLGCEEYYHPWILVKGYCDTCAPRALFMRPGGTEASPEPWPVSPCPPDTSKR